MSRNLVTDIVTLCDLMKNASLFPAAADVSPQPLQMVRRLRQPGLTPPLATIYSTTSTPGGATNLEWPRRLQTRYTSNNIRQRLFAVPP